jgi:death-on-curing protein
MNADANTCRHLSVAHVLAIHRAAIEGFGGSEGLRDLTLLQSAVFAPQASFGGASTFSDTVEVAAACLYYLCRNHPFVDGNKGGALGACLVFLKINGYRTAPDSEDWENLTLAVAAGFLSSNEITATLRKLLEDG